MFRWRPPIPPLALSMSVTKSSVGTRTRNSSTRSTLSSSRRPSRVVIFSSGPASGFRVTSPHGELRGFITKLRRVRRLRYSYLLLPNRKRAPLFALRIYHRIYQKKTTTVHPMHPPLFPPPLSALAQCPLGVAGPARARSRRCVWARKWVCFGSVRVGVRPRLCMCVRARRVGMPTADDRRPTPGHRDTSIDPPSTHHRPSTLDRPSIDRPTTDPRPSIDPPSTLDRPTIDPRPSIDPRSIHPPSTLDPSTLERDVSVLEHQRALLL